MLKYQIFFGSIVVLIIFWNLLLFKNGRIKVRRFIIFISFWLSVLLAVIFPEETNKIARFFNITRGADFFIYLSIMVIFYVLFKIFERIESLERNITEIVRHLALIDKDKEQ